MQTLVLVGLVWTVLSLPLALMTAAWMRDPLDV